MIDAIGYPINCGNFIRAQTPTYQFLKSSFGGDKFLIVATPVIRALSFSSSSSIIQKDIEYIKYSGSTTITDYNVNVKILEPNYPTNAISIISQDNQIILSPNTLGLASGITTGTTQLIATSDKFFSSTIINVNINNGTISSGIAGYASGSLAKNITDSIDTRTSGIIASTLTKSIFSTQNHNTATYVRNMSCWAASGGLDLTCISPWNSTGANTRAGTLISPRHIIFAAHYQIDVGSTIRFVDQNNNVVTRIIINKLTHPAYTPYYPDITIGILDSDVPASIGYAKILPQNWANYLPSLSSKNRLPCLYLDQEEKALIIDLVGINSSTLFNSPSIASRLSFYENIISGDSGDPFFLIVNNQLVILSVVTYADGAGTFISLHKDTINSMMNSLGGVYSLTEADLSSFSYFS
jgi:hypothetical protein